MKDRRMNDLEFEKDLAWADVFEIWRENEEDRENWKRLWKEKGFDSWEEWRMRYAEPFKLPEREWKLYRVKNVLKLVPTFRGGPFRAWVERFYDGREAPAFSELIRHPELKTHGGVIDIMNNFPEKTTISAVETADGIVIVEGMHRCAAIALSEANGKQINTTLKIALGSELPGELPVIGKFRKDETT